MEAQTEGGWKGGRELVEDYGFLTALIGIQSINLLPP